MARDDGLMPTEGKMYDALSQNQLVRKVELIRLLPSYDAGDEGSAERLIRLESALRFQLSELRKKLRPKGLDVVCHRNGSAENSHYGLSRLVQGGCSSPLSPI